MIGVILFVSLVIVSFVIIVYVIRDMSKSIKDYNQEEKINNKEVQKRARRRQIYYYK